MHDFEGAWVHLQSVRSVHFCEYCNAYELLLKTICNIRIAHSAINFHIKAAYSVTMNIFRKILFSF